MSTLGIFTNFMDLTMDEKMVVTAAWSGAHNSDKYHLCFNSDFPVGVGIYTSNDQGERKLFTWLHPSKNSLYGYYRSRSGRTYPTQKVHEQRCSSPLTTRAKNAYSAVSQMTTLHTADQPWPNVWPCAALELRATVTTSRFGPPLMLPPHQPSTRSKASACRCCASLVLTLQFFW